MREADEQILRECRAWIAAARARPVPTIPPEAKAAVLDLVEFLQHHPLVTRQLEEDLGMRPRGR